MRVVLRHNSAQVLFFAGCGGLDLGSRAGGMIESNGRYNDKNG